MVLKDDGLMHPSDTTAIMRRKMGRFVMSTTTTEPLVTNIRREMDM